ncbi:MULTISPECIES: site-2 protease family protein [Rhodomicrobium]|uniref:metalloprotease n=1 Tax=Rhodomicrobium TaxID=1068 RepID=UPI000B4B94DC|nr:MULTISPECIES: site-2 protease family protein [Rhodomicrobium]
MPKTLFSQSGSLLVLVFKLFKVFKSVKLLLAGATLATYSFLFTWQFALAIMWAIGVHELGHVWAMRKTGMKTPGFYFVPLFGGAAIGDRSKTEWQDVFITAMGPSWGLLSALPPAVMLILTGQPFWAGVIAFIALVNLFNLLPIYPLDGGRLANSLLVSVAPGAQILYLIAAGGLVLALTIYMKIYLVAILFAIGMVEIYFERRRLQRGEITPKPPLNRDGLIIGSVWYGGLALVFLLIIYGLQYVAGGDLALRVLR